MKSTNSTDSVVTLGIGNFVVTAGPKRDQSHDLKVEPVLQDFYRGHPKSLRLPQGGGQATVFKQFSGFAAFFRRMFGFSAQRFLTFIEWDERCNVSQYPADKLKVICGYPGF